jgi:prepilin-type processing-associated H-X9-DG protein
MICPECGSGNPEGAAVCGACSAILLGAELKGRSDRRVPYSLLSILTALLAAFGMASMGLTALLAIPVGIAAMVQLAGRKGQLRGWTPAIGGTALAVLLLGSSARIFYQHEYVDRPSAKCLMRVETIATALGMYAADYGAFPPSAHWQSDSLSTYITRGPDAYVCASAPKLRSGYAYNAALSACAPEGIGDTARVVAVFESDRGWEAAGGKELLPERPRHGRGDNFGFADGHARWRLRLREETNDSRNTNRPKQDRSSEGDYLIWQPPALPGPATSR